MACWIPSHWAPPKWVKDRDAEMAKGESPHQDAYAVECPVKAPPEPQPKPKRTRRTKAEILAAG